MFNCVSLKCLNFVHVNFDINYCKKNVTDSPWAGICHVYHVYHRGRVESVQAHTQRDDQESIPRCRTGPGGPPGYVGCAKSSPWNRFLGSLKV
jgi:hypothetical protein